jgi:hypothetical protein
VQQLKRSPKGVVVSFFEIRSAQKALAGDMKLEAGLPFRLSFHEPGNEKCVLIVFSYYLLFY